MVIIAVKVSISSHIPNDNVPPDNTEHVRGSDTEPFLC